MSAGAETTPRAFVVRFRDLHRWAVGSVVETAWRWPAADIKPLSDALSRKMVPVDRDPSSPSTLPLLTLHFDGEMEPRDVNAGDHFKGRLFHADPGDVVYSKIDVRNGAIGIIPENFGRMCVSSEYPVYSVDPKIAEARYIKLLFRTDAFRRKINSMISGASGRKRVQPTDLQTVKVPLPRLSIQREIVAAWESAQRAAADTAGKIEQLERDIESRFLADLGLKASIRATMPKMFAVSWKELARWGVQPNQRAVTSVDISTGKYTVVDGRDCLAEVKHGCSASPSPLPTSLEVLKISAVTRGSFDPDERKYAFDVPRYRREFGLRADDVLMCRTNGTLALVGMSALVERDMSNLIYPDKVIRVRCRSNILASYFWKLVQMSFARSQIEAAARTAVGNHAIGSDDIWDLRFPLPPLPIQRQIVERVTARRNEIARLKADAKARADAARADVEAMILGLKKVRAS